MNPHKKYLTPGQKREKAKKLVDTQISNRQGDARKLKRHLNELKKKITKEVKNDKGRVMLNEEVLDLPKAYQDLVDDNIIFKPHEGPQTDFLAASETDVLYGGQAGGGKSYSLIVDPLRYAHKAKHRGLILRKTLKELRELIDNTRELYPKAFPGCKYREGDKIWVFPSGAKIEFGYLEREADVYQYQGQAFSWIGFDELTHMPTEFAWNYLASRLRTTDPDIICYMRATTNPGGVGHAWVKKRYITQAPPNESFVYGRNPITDAPLTRKFIPARLSDNPTLYKDGNYQAMLQTLPEVQRKRLLEGNWDVDEGAAFPEFNTEAHIIEPFMIPAGWTRVKGVDYGYGSPSAVIWAAIDPDDGTIIVYRELYKKGLTADALGAMMVEMEVDEKRSILGVLDWAAWNRTGYTGPTHGQILCGPPYEQKLRPADKNRKAGKVQLHERFRIKESGRPGLQIFSSCPNTIREISSIPLDINDPEDVNTKAEDHAYDALRYLVMSRPRKESFDDIMFKFKEEMIYKPMDHSFGY